MTRLCAAQYQPPALIVIHKIEKNSSKSGKQRKKYINFKKFKAVQSFGYQTTDVNVKYPRTAMTLLYFEGLGSLQQWSFKQRRAIISMCRCHSLPATTNSITTSLLQHFSLKMNLQFYHRPLFSIKTFTSLWGSLAETIALQQPSTAAAAAAAGTRTGWRVSKRPPRINSTLANLEMSSSVQKSEL